MKRYNPDCKYDAEEFAELQPEPWQLDLLALNPDYCAWGVGEDYMATDGRCASSVVQGWSPRELNDLNEVANFHFALESSPAGCRVDLTLWLLYPRKGAAPGVRIEGVKRDDLPAVFAFLRTAADRNAARFAKVPAGGAS